LAPVAISSNNPQVVALLRSGNEALAKEDGMAAAISAYQQALELEPNNTDALTSLAIAYNLRGDWPNTEVQATALISATGGVGSAAALGHALLADALASLGGNKQALEEANKAIQLDSQLSLAYGIKSNALANLAVSRNEPQLMEQALDAVQQANVHITDEGDLYKAMTHNAIGFTYGQLSKYNDDPQALEIGKQEFIQATIIQSQIALFHSNLGYFYLNQQLYDLSRGEFDKAKQLDAGFAHAHTGLGLSYLLERNNDQAIQAFDEALKINPNDYEPYYGRGKALIAQGKYPEAAQSLSTATELNPRFDELYAWLGEAYIGIRYVSTDETTRKQAVDRAFEAYQKALALNDRSAMALTGLGWALQYQGSYDQSIEQFRQSLAIDETQYEAHNGLGWSLYNRGIAIANAGNEAEAAQNFEEAGGNFLRATQLKIDYDDAFLGLGHTLVRRGLLEDAKKAYEAAVGFNSDNTEARAALNRLLQQQQP
jgi:serine/threonine-protein kinase